MLMGFSSPVIAARVPVAPPTCKLLIADMILLSWAGSAECSARPSAGQRTLARTLPVALRAWLAWLPGSLQALAALEAQDNHRSTHGYSSHHRVWSHRRIPAACRKAGAHSEHGPRETQRRKGRCPGPGRCCHQGHRFRGRAASDDRASSVSACRAARLCSWCRARGLDGRRGGGRRSAQGRQRRAAAALIQGAARAARAGALVKTGPDRSVRWRSPAEPPAGSRQRSRLPE